MLKLLLGFAFLAASAEINVTFLEEYVNEILDCTGTPGLTVGVIQQDSSGKVCQKFVSLWL